MSDRTSPARQAVVVMGVAGSGKTSVAQALADRLGWTFAEADDFHPAANITKMTAGHPLTDADRRPWLDAIGAWLDDQAEAGRDVVVTCSALRRAYRDRLRCAGSRVRFCHLTAPEAVLSERITSRKGHFMPPSMLASQLATLEPLDDDEDGVVVDVSGTQAESVDAAVSALGLG